MTMQDFSPDATSKKIYELETGNKIIVERKNPYGFIGISLERGITPESLTGQFTSYDEADKAITSYLSLRNKVLKEVRSSLTEEVKDTQEEAA